MNNKTVNFILPGGSKNPAGGYKVVFEYSNLLISKGFRVNIVMPATLLWKERSIKEKLKGIVKYFYFGRNKSYLPYYWFPLNEKIKIFWTPSLEEKYIPDGDYIFATAVQTAEYVNEYGLKKGEKFYLIQSFEDWALPKDRVLKTWKFPMKKIVISKHLLEVAKNLNEEATYIENGLDFDKFFKDSKIEKIPYRLMMLYHTDEKVKQSKKAVEKLIKLKNKIPELTLTLFGVPSKPENLPEWIEYYQKPNSEIHRKLYNQAQIFLSPSKIEGWALPPAEAMQSGTCACVTDIPGHEYVEHMKTGYKFSSSLENMSEAIEFLFENQNEIEKLANNGNEYIQRFTWEIACEKFIKLLKES